MKQLEPYFVLLCMSTILFAPKLEITISDPTGGAELIEMVTQMQEINESRKGYLQVMIHFKEEFRKTKDTRDLAKYLLARNELSSKVPNTKKTIKRLNGEMLTLASEKAVKLKRTKGEQGTPSGTEVVSFTTTMEYDENDQWLSGDEYEISNNNVR